MRRWAYDAVASPPPLPFAPPLPLATALNISFTIHATTSPSAPLVKAAELVVAGVVGGAGGWGEPLAEAGAEVGVDTAATVWGALGQGTNNNSER